MKIQTPKQILNEVISEKCKKIAERNISRPGTTMTSQIGLNQSRSTTTNLHRQSEKENIKTLKSSLRKPILKTTLISRPKTAMNNMVNSSAKTLVVPAN